MSVQLLKLYVVNKCLLFLYCFGESVDSLQIIHELSAIIPYFTALLEIVNVSFAHCDEKEFLIEAA